jgi:hypothetical protein
MEDKVVVASLLVFEINNTLKSQFLKVYRHCYFERNYVSGTLTEVLVGDLGYKVSIFADNAFTTGFPFVVNKEVQISEMINHRINQLSTPKHTWTFVSN